MTALTDVLLCAVAFGLGARLFRSEPRESGRARRLWGLAFGLSGLAALAGAVLHGRGPWLPPAAVRAGWQVVFHAMATASFLLVTGTLRARVAAPLRAWLTALFGLKLLAQAYWMSGHPEFRYLVFDYASGLLCVLLCELGPLARGEASARGIVPGIAAAFLAAWLQQQRCGFGPAFNHNDLYHVLQMGVFWLLARGGLQLRDEGS
jgi:hypothetical protein